MSINYSSYTLDELIDVYHHIDKEQYPERFKQLCDEIDKRQQGISTHTVDTNNSGYFEEDDSDDDESNDFIIDFKSNKFTPSRLIAGGLIALVNIVILSFLLPKYHVKPLADTQQFITTIDTAQCKKIQLYDDESETTTTVYDLIVTVVNDEFTALSIDGRMCQQVVNSINPEQNLTIWHYEGLIYQLSNQSGILLSYNYLKAIIYNLQTDDATSLWIVFIWFWLFIYKTAANVILPGTFKNEE